MSSICVGVVKIEDSNNELKKALKKFVENRGWGIMFDTYYYPLAERIEGKNLTTFDLTDFPDYRNCERLLCEDWFTINEEKNKYPLVERLGFIKDVIRLCLKSVDNMEFYIGDFSTDIEEFLFYEIEWSEFVYTLMSLYNKYHDIPCVHFYIKNESNKTNKK